MPKKTDYIVISLLFLLISLFFCATIMTSNGDSPEKYLQISINGEVKYKVSLSDNREIDLKEEHVKITVNNNRAMVSESDCPDRVCIKSGYIEKEGESIICLPNRLSLKIVGGEADYDAVSGK